MISQTVTLNTTDFRLSLATAYVRNEHAIRQGKRAKLGSGGAKHLGIHEVGCLGEMIAMNALGIPKPVLSINTYQTEPDIPPGACEAFPEGAEVRTRLDLDVPYPIEMPIRENDNPDMPFIMVLLDPESRASGRVAGWIKAAEAMDHSEWFKNPGNKPGGDAWMVPQEALYQVQGVIA